MSISHLTFERNFNGAAVDPQQLRKINKLEAKINGLGFKLQSQGREVSGILPLRNLAEHGDRVTDYIEKLECVCALINKARRLTFGARGIYGSALIFQGIKFAGNISLGVVNAVIFAPLGGDPGRLIPHEVHATARAASLIFDAIASKKITCKDRIQAIEETKGILRTQAEQQRTHLHAETERSNVGLQDEIRQLEAEIAEKTADVQSLESTLSQMGRAAEHSLVRPQEVFFNSLQKKNEDLQREIEDLTSILEQKKEDLPRRVEALRNDLEMQLQEINEQLTRELDKLENDRKVMVEQLNSDITKLRATLPSKHRLYRFGSSFRFTLQSTSLIGGRKYSWKKVKDLWKGASEVDVEFVINRICSKRGFELKKTAKKTALTLLGVNVNGTPHVPLSDLVISGRFTRIESQYKYELSRKD
ncbi:MAG: hypothetical protein PVI40_02810 [Chlamydiota bacterium]|jgi:hypothetical protein